MNRYIRICPVCDTENPPDRVHCSACATLLAGVDFSLPRQTPEAGETEGAPVEPGAVPMLADQKPAPAPERDAAANEAAHAGAAAVAGASSLRWPDLPGLGAPAPEAATPAATSPTAGSLLCPDPDCGQPNPPGTARCLYCNTPLPQKAPLVPAEPATGAASPSGFELAPPALDSVPSPSLPTSVSRPVLPTNLRTNLPGELAARYRVVDELQAAGSEADLLIVEPLAGGEALVAKLYRRGIQPDSALLARLSAAGPHVVNFLGYGVADGVAWELMEYCRAGNLRDVIRRGLLSRDTLQRLVQELAAGLMEVHAQRILHRDLKPENVLVRRREPLSLALTDFGIASLSEGTRHFTDGARTVKYAAPEALTGIIDAKADWWSVGMILLEAASGRHPFDGLSEQVINHHLATRPVDITGVADEDFSRLCRGLLLRDPSRRWGGPEVERWLAGDPTLVLPVETGAATVRPYHVGEYEARSGEELALALAAHWPEGVQDLKRGLLRDWLKEELHDFNLTRRLADIMEARGESDDRRLLRFLLAAAPQLPPVWQGRPAHREALLAAARQAQEGGETADEARRWLDSLFEDGVLALFARQGEEELEALDRAWRQGLEQVRLAWQEAGQAYRRWATRPQAVQGNEQARVVDFDAVVYGRDGELPPPSRPGWHPLLLMALTSAEYRSALETDSRRAAQELAEDAPWFAGVVAALPQASQADAEAVPGSMRGAGGNPQPGLAALLVAWQLKPLARRRADQERQQRAARIAAREATIVQLRQDAANCLLPLTLIAELPDGQVRRELRLGLEQFHAFAVRVGGMDFPEPSFVRLLRQLNALQRLGFNLEQALDQVERVEGVWHIFQQENRLGLAAGIVLMFFILGPAWLAPLSLAGLAGFVVWGLLRRRQARLQLGQQLQSFQRQCQHLFRSTQAEPPLRRTRLAEE